MVPVEGYGVCIAPALRARCSRGPPGSAGRWRSRRAAWGSGCRRPSDPSRRDARRGRRGPERHRPGDESRLVHLPVVADLVEGQRATVTSWPLHFAQSRCAQLSPGGFQTRVPFVQPRWWECCSGSVPRHYHRNPEQPRPLPLARTRRPHSVPTGGARVAEVVAVRRPRVWPDESAVSRQESGHVRVFRRNNSRPRRLQSVRRPARRGHPGREGRPRRGVARGPPGG